MKTEDVDFATMFKPTSPGSHREISLAWLEAVKPTLIDQWPPELAALSMPTKFVSVPKGLIEEMWGMHDGKAPGPIMDALALELDKEMGWQRKFVRLNSRSPKDWPYPFEVPATCSGKEALGMLAGSERVLDDLYEFSWVPEQPAFVCLRDWVYWIKKDAEFRCFVKDGKLIGVTHYDYTKEAPRWVAENAESLRKNIDNYFKSSVKAALPIETVVFDVALNRRDESLMLIEINPYGRSDPCWFGSYAAVENASRPIQFTEPDDPTHHHANHRGGDK